MIPWPWPAPVDDGGASHLRVADALPDVALPSTTGAPVSLARLTGRNIIFVYTWTGRPGMANPPAAEPGKVAPGMNDVGHCRVGRDQNGSSTRRSFQRSTADLGPMRSTVTPGAAASPSRTTWPLIITKRLLALSE